MLKSLFRFRFTEDDTAIDYFGEQLKAAGYNYYGNEPMYSGITGQEFAADIYIGVVYYQRLRHMVLDKFQVRTTGPIDPLTRQPVKVRGPNLQNTRKKKPPLTWVKQNSLLSLCSADRGEKGRVASDSGRWNETRSSRMGLLSCFRIG
jgi:hypothetical protein